MKQLYIRKCKAYRGKLAFHRVTDFTSGKFAQENFHVYITDNNTNYPSKILGGLKGRFVPPGKPTKKKVRTCSA